MKRFGCPCEVGIFVRLGYHVQGVCCGHVVYDNLIGESWVFGGGEGVFPCC